MGNSALASLISIGCFTYTFDSHLPIPKYICIRETEILLREEGSKQWCFKKQGSALSLQRGQGGF